MNQKVPVSRGNIVFTYTILVFIWATTPLAIVWSVHDLHVMWAMVIRFFIALPLAALLLLLLRVKLPIHKVALHSYIAGSFSLIGSQIFTYAATGYLSSGIIALMFGLAPIMAGLIGRFLFKQHLYSMHWLGMGIAVAGLSIICLGGSTGQQVHPVGILLMLLSVFNYALSIFWVKKVNAQVEPMAQATRVRARLYAAASFHLAVCTETYSRYQIVNGFILYGDYGISGCNVLLFQTGPEHSGNYSVFNQCHDTYAGYSHWFSIKS